MGNAADTAKEYTLKETLTEPYFKPVGIQNWRYLAKISNSDKIIAIWETSRGCEFIPEFESGRPKIKSDSVLTRKPINGVIRKIHLYHSDEWLAGIRFFDDAGQMIYQSAYKNGFISEKHEIILNEGQQILGFQSREMDPGCAEHCDFQFIIGSL